MATPYLLEDKELVSVMLRQARPLATRPMADFVYRHGGIRSRLISTYFHLWALVRKRTR